MLPGNPGGDTRHWRYIEFGIEHIGGQPFMRPAFSNNVSAVTERFVTTLNTEIDALLGGWLMYAPIFAVCAADPAVTALLGTSPVRIYPFGEAPEGAWSG